MSSPSKTAPASFDWLPDAALDPHPRLTWLFECAFDLAVAAFYRKEEILPQDYALAPGTFIVSNHLRDSDTPILTTTVCQRRGRYIRYPMPFYASREDLLRPRFLHGLAIDAGLGQGVATVLGWIRLGWFFRIMRVRPMRRVREFNFNETLAALCATDDLGATPPARWLRRSTLAQIESHLGYLPETLHQLHRAHLGRYGLQCWGLRLRPAAVRRVAPALRATIERQLNDFADLLDAGRCVYFAPEGTLSDDGRMRPFRRGTALVYARTKTPPTLLPIALSYDPFQRGRLRVVVQIGHALQGLDPTCTREFNARLKQAILALRAVTPSHLLAYYLATGPDRFTLPELTQWMHTACTAVRETGLTLDPVFARSNLDELVRLRLAWLAHHRLVTRAEDYLHWTNLWSQPTASGHSRTLRNAHRLAAAFEDWADIAPGLLPRLKT